MHATMAAVCTPWQGQCACPGRRPAVKSARLQPARAASIVDAEVASSSTHEQRRLEKEGWQSAVRDATGRRKHRVWEPQLAAPPPLLEDVCVVLLSPKRPVSVGTVARSLGAFECMDLRLVQPRCDPLARSGRNSAKGAQFLIWRAQRHDSLQAALADAELSVACTRWVAGRPNAFRSVAELLAAPEVAALLAQCDAAGSSSGDASSSSSGSSSSGSSDGGEQREGGGQQPRRKLALVFGREVEGLLPEEADACDCTLSIPIGRLQESLSLSHAVSVVLSRIFEARQQASGYALPQGRGDLAAGFEETGVER